MQLLQIKYHFIEPESRLFFQHRGELLADVFDTSYVDSTVFIYDIGI